ncbi:TPA: hypothetical protein PJH62_003065 [Acinetobacter nosocomialis]|uniref:hypothetical protein n=1 Tax=Acinetobacter nosocomialis TaxID=106654 RepID=UPI00237DC134|nr:hypothetical protein [Acinetobacter nosocomialis]MDE1667353.1 hypothetical protein [Acinetobacter nosocomialis]HDH7780480.1 hypothetical protein [Acinetobacter nosocomialis]
MATMFQSINTSNSVQIDDDYANLSFYGKTEYQIGLYPIDTQSSLKAYNCNDNITFTVAIGGDHTGNFNNPKLCYLVGTLFPPKSDPNNFPKVISHNFNKSMSDSNFGMSVYGTTGQLLYNSNAKPLRVLDRITGRIETSEQFADKVLLKNSYPGRKVAVVFGQQPLGAQVGATNDPSGDQSKISLFTLVATLSDSGSTIEVKYSYSFTGSVIFGGGGTWSNHMQNVYDILIVDVTGY